MADHDEREEKVREAFEVWRREDPLSGRKIDRFDRRTQADDQYWRYKAREYDAESCVEQGPFPKVAATRAGARKARHRSPYAVKDSFFATAYQRKRWWDLKYLHIEDLYQAFDAQAVILWTALEEFYRRTRRATTPEIDTLRELGRVQFRMGPQTKVLWLRPERDNSGRSAVFEPLGFHIQNLGAVHPRHGGPLVIPGINGPGRAFDPTAVPVAKDGAKGRAGRAIAALFGRSPDWVHTVFSRFAALNRDTFPFSMKVRPAELTFMWVDRPKAYLHVAFPAAMQRETRIERVWAEEEPGAFGWVDAVTPNKDSVISP